MAPGAQARRHPGTARRARTRLSAPSTRPERQRWADVGAGVVAGHQQAGVVLVVAAAREVDLGDPAPAPVVRLGAGPPVVLGGAVAEGLALHLGDEPVGGAALFEVADDGGAGRAGGVDGHMAAGE